MSVCMKPLQRAIKILEELLADPRLQRRGRLPSLRQCAVLAGVSKNTMSRAVADLKQRGCIVPVAGRGLLIGAAAAAHPSVSLPDLGGNAIPVIDACDRVKGSIRGDIVSGAFPAGQALPPYKELCHRYATGAGTIRRALNELAGEIHLVSHKRGFAAPESRLRSRASVVLLYPRGTLELRGNLFLSPRLEAMRSEERRVGKEC
jgi:DNA-binding transcriptional regulator YhcF (GntR family)